LPASWSTLYQLTKLSAEMWRGLSMKASVELAGRTLARRQGGFRLERIAGWALHPLESATLSQRTWKPVIRSPRWRGRELMTGSSGPDPLQRSG
jgi:hypothetical protein